MGYVSPSTPPAWHSPEEHPPRCPSGAVALADKRCLCLPCHGRNQCYIAPSLDRMHDPLGFITIVERPKPDVMQRLHTLRRHANPDVWRRGVQGFWRRYGVVLTLIGTNLLST